MFHPSHCPNTDCGNFIHPRNRTWYRKITPYTTSTFGTVPRFICKSCKKSFSKQTFSFEYYGKKRMDNRYIYDQINAGAGIRNIARQLSVSPKTITNRINRLARNAIIIQEKILKQLPFHEDFAADGFESFCISQYFPDNYTILVGSNSQFVYSCQYTTLRRKGRMTPHQRCRREKLEKSFRADPKGLKEAFGALGDLLALGTQSRKDPLILYTDEKKDYERALWSSPICTPRLYSGRWRHHQINSKEGRNAQNPLFPVNYMDREIRKDMANHSRETVQFSRNVNNAMLRMSLYLFDHNCMKPYRVAHPEKRSLRHAQVAGLKRDVLDDLLIGFFKNRLFWMGEHEIGGPGRKSLERGWQTPLKKHREVVPKYMAA